jgi:argininosuccinate lyase
MITKTIQNEILLTEARLSAPPAARLIRYYDLPHLEREKCQYREFVAVDLAHTTMLVEEDIISRAVGRPILQQLLRMKGMNAEDFPTDAYKGSFLLQVESYLFATIGEDVGGQMHTGRSRIDQGATVRRLYKRNRMLDVMDRLNGLQAVIVEQAARHARTIMPGYTHMQHSQPGVFGHYLLGFSTRLHDSFERLTQAYARVNRNPLGAVGLAGTSWPLNRARTTELLGFDAILENSKLGRESWYAAEAIGALSFVMADLNDLATDLHLWSTEEFGFVESDDSYCGTSSIFPQKKNPVALETIKKAAGEAVTWLATALATFRAEGTGDQAMRDLPLINGALQTTEGMLDLFAGVLETLIVHEERMSALLVGSWCTASNLADTIVRESGMSFRQAHHIVARVVRDSVAAGIKPAQLTGAALDQAARETIGVSLCLGDTRVRDALDPRRFVETRVTTGSIGPSEVAQLLVHAQAECEADCGWVATARRKLSLAQAELDSAVAGILA